MTSHEQSFKSFYLEKRFTKKVAKFFNMMKQDLIEHIEKEGLEEYLRHDYPDLVDIYLTNTMDYEYVLDKYYQYIIYPNHLASLQTGGLVLEKNMSNWIEDTPFDREELFDYKEEESSEKLYEWLYFDEDNKVMYSSSGEKSCIYEDQTLRIRLEFPNTLEKKHDRDLVLDNLFQEKRINFIKERNNNGL